jgi:aryl sulfotransferase
MAAANVAWPKKTREFHNHHFDSTIWNDFRSGGSDTSPLPQDPSAH